MAYSEDMIHAAEIRLQQAGVAFEVRIPNPRLSPWVDSYWVSEGKPCYTSERIIADGTSTLIFNFGASLRTALNGSRIEERSSFFAGVNTRFADVFHGGDRLQAGIRFKAGGVYPFLQQSLTAFRDQTVEMELVGRPDLDELLDALGNARVNTAKLELLEGWMLRCLRRSGQPDPRLEAALRILRTNPGLKIEALADQLGCSRQYLSRLFHTYAGAGPKSFQRALRISHAIQQLRPGHAADWIGLANQGSFFDQAHLIHEFQHMTGLSPEAYQQTLDKQVGRMILR